MQMYTAWVNHALLFSSIAKISVVCNCLATVRAAAGLYHKQNPCLRCQPFDNPRISCQNNFNIFFQSVDLTYCFVDAIKQGINFSLVLSKHQWSKHAAPDFGACWWGFCCSTLKIGLGLLGEKNSDQNMNPTPDAQFVRDGQYSNGNSVPVTGRLNSWDRRYVASQAAAGYIYQPVFFIFFAVLCCDRSLFSSRCLLRSTVEPTEEATQPKRNKETTRSTTDCLQWANGEGIGQYLCCTG